MIKPRFITFTGLDTRTSLIRAAELSERYPVEWGVLFSESKQGNDPRYPDRDSLELLKNFSNDLILSAHICGKYSRRIMDGDLLIDLDLSAFTRTQVNTTSPDYDQIADFADYHELVGITQFRTLEVPEDPDIYFLYDCSGGRGERPDKWPVGLTDNFLGYAGGIGPDNVLDVISEIDAQEYWIDMESKVRTDNWLDLDKCEAVLKQVYG